MSVRAQPRGGRAPRLHAGLRRHGRHEVALRLAVPRPARPQCPSGGRAGTEMADAIAVLNAGSSSFKFSLFAEGAKGVALVARGQAEGLYTSPRFVAKDGSGAVIDEKSWGEGVELGHTGALDHLVAFLRKRLAEHRLVGVGHRVVHGGLEYTKHVRVDASVLDALEKYVPLAPLHQPHNLAPIRALARAVAAASAGCMFRYCVPPRSAGRRAGVRPAQVDHGSRRDPLRLPRPVV